MVAIRFDVLESELAALRTRHNQAQGQRDLLQQQLREKEQQLTQAQADIDLWRQVQILLAKTSEFARQQLVQRLQTTVTAALQAVFDRDDIRFEIELKTIGNAPAANWSISSFYGDTEIKTEPESARGGGYVDIVSLALRLALLELARPKPEGSILLDEPGKMISKEYLPNVAEFLKSYAAKTGRQILMVTHHEALADVADKGFNVSQVNGVSEVVQNV